LRSHFLSLFFSITDTSPTLLYTLSLHDALPIYAGRHLAVTDNPYLVGDTTQRLINRLTRNRPLLQRLLHAGAQLRLIVRLADIVDRKSTRLNSSHVAISYAVFCLKKKKKNDNIT